MTKESECRNSHFHPGSDSNWSIACYTVSMMQPLIQRHPPNPASPCDKAKNKKGVSSPASAPPNTSPKKPVMGRTAVPLAALPPLPGCSSARPFTNTPPEGRRTCRSPPSLLAPQLPHPPLLGLCLLPPCGPQYIPLPRSQNRILDPTPHGEEDGDERDGDGHFPAVT
jgi:hypothetical protein